MFVQVITNYDILFQCMYEEEEEEEDTFISINGPLKRHHVHLQTSMIQQQYKQSYIVVNNSH